MRVAAIPLMSGVSAAASVPLGSFPSCVPFPFLVLFVMAAPWAGPAGPVGLGRPDSRASQGAAATHSSNSTASGTSPVFLDGEVVRSLAGKARDVSCQDKL